MTGMYLTQASIFSVHTDSVGKYCAISSDNEGVEEEVVRVEGSSVKGLLETVSSSSAKLKTPAVWDLMYRNRSATDTEI